MSGAFSFSREAGTMMAMKAPEFPQDVRWLNSPPIKLRELKNKVVLIDFWTYSCINCIRTLPYVKQWHERYKAEGLVVIGVHTPEFDFEKEFSNVERAVKEAGINYPVVMDSDYTIWSAYANNVWPRKFLINKDGHIVYDHVGEGGYKETEEAIQVALKEINSEIELPAPTEDEGSGGICYPTTAETYLGSSRGRQGSVWTVTGDWKTHTEYIEHIGGGTRDFLELHFEATEVNCVMEARNGSAKISLELDGKPYKDIEVRGAKMYHLVESPEYLRGTLKIFVRDPGFRLYAFTFGGCAIPPDKAEK
jgi:thiol-disulfide isomerase/thioredoxin